MLTSIRFFTLTALLAAVGFGAACTGEATGPSEMKPVLINLQPLHGLLQCTPQLFASGSALIGPNGGEIKVGKNKFTVPKGALSKLTLITMQVPTDAVRSVRFLPEGLVFNAGAQPRLKLDYKGCSKSKTPMKVAYTTEQLKVLEVLPSATDSVNATVDAPIKHFSRYAVYY